MFALRHLLLTPRFFLIFGSLVACYVIGSKVSWVLGFAQFGFIVLTLLVVMDAMILWLFVKQPPLERIYQSRMNLGDINQVSLKSAENWPSPILPWWVEINEGYPNGIASNRVTFKQKITAEKALRLDYSLAPKERGSFQFSEAYVFLRSVLGLAERRFIHPVSDQFHVYPSILQMRKYELLVFQQQKTGAGIKRIRRLGNATEFEQIRNYVPGDELKTINWKATSRKGELMVNQYQDEKSQSVYCVIDKSRTMQMTSQEMTLLDHSINSALVFANICLHKGDKVGLVSYSNKMGTQIPAERKPGQLRAIMEALYDQKTQFLDANFELLQSLVRQKIKTRSMILLFTNFENEYAMRRAMPYLLQINKQHLLVVLFFQNMELKALSEPKPENIKELYTGVVAEKMFTLKDRMAREMKQMGIQTILTNPEELSVQVINKYLELKARGRF